MLATPSLLLVSPVPSMRVVLPAFGWVCHPKKIAPYATSIRLELGAGVSVLVGLSNGDTVALDFLANCMAAGMKPSNVTVLSRPEEMKEDAPGETADRRRCAPERRFPLPALSTFSHRLARSCQLQLRPGPPERLAGHVYLRQRHGSHLPGRCSGQPGEGGLMASHVIAPRGAAAPWDAFVHPRFSFLQF